MSSDDKKRKRAEELNNSRPLDVHKRSGYPEVNNAVDELWEMFKALPGFKGKEKVQKRHIKTTVIDLYDAYLTDPTMYVAFHRGRSAYSKGERYNKLHITHLTPSIVDCMEKLGLLEQVKGHYDRSGTGSSHISRMKATTSLTDFIQVEHEITPVMVELAPDTECIILREKEKSPSNASSSKKPSRNKSKSVDIDYIDTPETIRMRDELTAYNNLLRRKHIDIPESPVGGIPTRSGKRNIVYNPRNKFVRRIFNGTWDSGGRFYGGDWQRIPSEWRSKIRINEMPVIELDYSGLHVILCYAEASIDYWDSIGTDPYELDGFEKSERMRDLLKEILLVAINAKDKKTAIKAIQNKINKKNGGFWWVKEEGLSIDDVIDAFVEKHKPIENRFFSGSGLRLQNVDSMMAEYVINEFVKLDTAVLTVHDSFIVPYYAKDVLEMKMQEAFESIVSKLVSNKAGLQSKLKVGEVNGQTWSDVSTRRDAYLMAQKKVDPMVRPRYVQGLMEHREHNWEDEYYGERDEDMVSGD